jgi:hypothetical protein
VVKRLLNNERQQFEASTFSPKGLGKSESLGSWPEGESPRTQPLIHPGAFNRLSWKGSHDWRILSLRLAMLAAQQPSATEAAPERLTLARGLARVGHCQGLPSRREGTCRSRRRKRLSRGLWNTRAFSLSEALWLRFPGRPEACPSEASGPCPGPPCCLQDPCGQATATRFENGQQPPRSTCARPRGGRQLGSLVEQHKKRKILL